MALFGLIKSGKTTIKKGDNTHSQELLDQLEKYLAVHDYTRAGDIASELTKDYQSLAGDRAGIYARYMGIMQAAHIPGSASASNGRDAGAQDNVPSEMLDEYKKTQEALVQELAEVKAELATREQLFTDVLRRLDEDRLKNEGQMKALQDQVESLRALKETQQEEMTHFSAIENQLNTTILNNETKRPMLTGLSSLFAKRKTETDVPAELPAFTMPAQQVLSVGAQACFTKTGIAGFDEMVPKGIPSNSTVLIAGGPGSGKTIFCLQVAHNAASKGESCLYLTFEEEPERLIQHMNDFGWDAKRAIDAGRLCIKKMEPMALSRSVEGLLAKARGELIIELNEISGIIPDGFKPDKIILDSLSAVAAAFAGRDDGYRIYVEQLFGLFKSTGATSFLITEIEQDTARYSRSGIEEFLADAVISFYSIRKGSAKASAIEIIKIRGAEFRKKLAPFRIVGGRGIEVYPQEEIFT